MNEIVLKSFNCILNKMANGTFSVNVINMKLFFKNEYVSILVIRLLSNKKEHVL